MHSNSIKSSNNRALGPILGKSTFKYYKKAIKYLKNQENTQKYLEKLGFYIVFIQKVEFKTEPFTKNRYF